MHSNINSPDNATNSKVFTSFVLLTLVQLSFSGWHIIGGYAFNEQNADPIVFAFYREILASFFMGALFIIIQWYNEFEPKTTVEAMGEMKDALLGEDCKMFLFLGSMSFCNVMGATLALSLAPPIIFAILQPLIPCIATALSMGFKFEPFNQIKIAGILLAVAGAISVEAWKDESSDDDSNSADETLGVVITFFQVTACATYLVFQKSILDKYHSTLVTFSYYGIGSVLTAFTCAIYAFATGMSTSTMALDYSLILWGAVSYVVIFSTLYAWNAYTYASKYLAPSISTIFMALQPVFTAILSFIVYDKVLSIPQIFGGLLVCTGMLVTVRGGNATDLIQYKKLTNDEALRITLVEDSTHRRFTLGSIIEEDEESDC